MSEITTRRASAMLTRLTEVRKIGMAGLLALLAFGIFVLPVIVAGGADLAWPGRLLLILILFSGIAAIGEHRRLAAVLWVLAIAVICARFLDGLFSQRLLSAWHDPLTLVALVVLAIAIGINVFASRRTIGDRLSGAIALYLLLGLIWAIIYAIVATILPNAFAGTLPAHATLFDWGYFSLVTLTTVGYGDITPVARVARSLAALEALVGQLYPAIIIARLVSARDS